MLEARAALRVAYCDLASSRVAQALEAARRAAGNLRTAASPVDEVDALALGSRAASLLGRSVEAVESALLATQLAEALPAGLWTARAHLSLGMAYSWGLSFAQATRAFDTAAQVAERHADEAARHEVRVERHWAEALRGFDQREHRVAASAWDGAPGRVEPPWAANAFASTHTVTPGAAANLPVSAAVVGGLLQVWSGDAAQARALLARCLAVEGGPAAAGWLLAAQSWLQAELAIGAGELDVAAWHAGRMSAWALEAEHLPLTCLGHRLGADIQLPLGRPDLAVVELRQQLLHEQTVQGFNLEGRHEAVGHHVAARRGKIQLGALAESAMRFEQWAYEDPLTGIPNLRRFNQCLTEWSAAAADAGKPLCVALIDVDHFRDINNLHPYETGNDALRAIAALMVAHVRATDLPARWGGDEFAILFRDTDMATALQITHRIQTAVQHHDWACVAAGLSVRISVGVTEARPDDDKKSLIARSELTMYEQKMARRQAEVERAVPAAVVRRVGAWLQSAKRVVVYVGNADVAGDAAEPIDALAAGSPHDRSAYGHAQGWMADAAAFENHWTQWRQAKRARKPVEADSRLVELSHKFASVTFITARVDGLLTRSGADNVIELYGNALRDRCSACNRVSPNSDSGHCLACDASGHTIRPDIVLLGEYPDPNVLAGAELIAKRADVVLVVGSDATTYPGAGLLDKARTRGARIVFIGSGQHTRRAAAHVAIAASPDVVLQALHQAMDACDPNGASGGSLTGSGFAALTYLTGQRADTFGFTIEQALAWKDSEIERHLGTLPWLFPLPTRSRMNPDAPMPSREDFRLLAADDGVRSAMRAAFRVMLRFYGFQWGDGHVEKSPNWTNGFAGWAATPCHHDLFISRILGALRLTGLQAEAAALLRAAEVELKHYRGSDAHGPLRHWRLAVAA